MIKTTYKIRAIDPKTNSKFQMELETKQQCYDVMKSRNLQGVIITPVKREF